MDIQKQEEQQDQEDFYLFQSSPPSQTKESKTDNEFAEGLFETDNEFAEGLFESREALIDYVKNYAKAEGFVVVIKKSAKDVNVVLGCDRGGTYRSRRALIDHKRKKQTCSRLVNCPFKVTGTRRVDGSWSLRIKNKEHNHEASKVILGHSYIRHFTEEEVSKIKSMTTANKQPREILTTLRESNPELQVIARDLYNVKAKICKDNLAGRSPIHALLDELSSGGFEFNLNHDEENRLTHLFFAHPSSIKLTKSYANIFVMDCTYKTNKYRMPLLEVVGITSFNTSFFSCFAFLMKEEEEDYVWALKSFKNVFGDNGEPTVVVTKYELALMKAITMVFPSTVNLLCLSI